MTFTPRVQAQSDILLEMLATFCFSISRRLRLTLQLELRRNHSNMSVSPPPLKRRRVNSHDDEAATPPDRTPNNDQLQIYSWNVNGIQPFVQRPITSFFEAKQPSKRPNTDATTAPTASLRDFLRRHDWPTMLFLQEVKINPDDEATKSAVKRAVKPTKDTEPEYIAHFCLPSDLYNARGFGRKVYGVCTIIRKDFVDLHQPSVRTVDWDREGRIQIVETAHPKLSIWNIYAVNGTENPYKDSNTGEVTGTRHDRKLAVHKLMLEETKTLEAQGYGVILAGDMNIARDTLDGHPNLRTFPQQHVVNRLDFNDKFFDGDDGMKGVDTFRHVHGDKRGYTYYPRGKPFGSSCDRVDLIVCSRSLKETIVDAGVLATPAERGPSDHVPLYASFDIN